VITKWRVMAFFLSLGSDFQLLPSDILRSGVEWAGRELEGVKDSCSVECNTGREILEG
jgi:hypothetical protein